MPSIAELQTQFHQQNKDKGFYDYERDIKTVRNFIAAELPLLSTTVISELGRVYRDELEAISRLVTDYERAMLERKMLLVIGEVCEAHEELRAGYTPRQTYYGVNGKPEGFPVEIADAAIRLMDLSGAAGNDLQTDILEKNAYNVTRPYKHGKQF